MRKLVLMVLGLLFFAGQLLAQTRQVSGRVLDESGKPVPNASVTVKGTNQGTTSNADGYFTLSVPANAKLIVTAIGLTAQEISVGNNTEVNLTLKAEDKAMQEVVVVGYGTARKKDLVGNVASVKGSVIKDLPVQSFDQALSGRATGVSVTMPNGVLNNPPVIRVRGVNSISLSSFPLVVVDGVPTYSGNVGGTASNNPLGNINPNDIESVEILKDAAAAAIYGSRASAGVLLITTKRGKQGRARVNYDGWVGWTKAFNLIDVLNAEQYTTIKNEGLTNLGTPPVPAPGTPARGFFTQTDANGQLIDTRWYDYIYRSGMQQNHSVNVSGASDKTSYFFSAGFTDQEGMLRGNDFRRVTARMTVDHKVNNWLQLGGTMNYTNSTNAAPNTGSLPGQAFGIAGLGRLPIILAPNVAPRNADGSYNINTAANTIGQGNNRTALSFYNPVYLLENNRFTSENDQITGNVFAQLNFTKWLNFRTIYGIDNLNVQNKEFRAALHGDGVQFGGAAQNTQQTFRRWNWQNLLTFDKQFGEHNVNVLVGNEQQYTNQQGWGADRRGQTDIFYDEFQGGFASIVPAGNFFGENYLVSFLGRLNYNYGGKYYLSLNARRDGYSAFAPENKYGNFYGGSVGWVLTNEKFFQDLNTDNWLNNFRLRASWGLVGNNQGINDYAFYSFFNSGLYGTQPNLFFSQAGNRNLRWETSTKTDIGFDASFFKSRVNVEFSYYKNDIDNLILNDPQSPSAGIPGNAILTNIGRMVNTGFELAINTTPIRTQNFVWNSNFNITTLRNEVKSLAQGNADIFVQTSGLEQPSIIRVGESIGSFYAVRTNGVNPATGQRIFTYRDGREIQYNHAATQRWTFLDGTAAPRGADQANDGVIIGPALPRYTGGWDNTFRFKGFDLNILFFFSGGNYVYNGTKAGLRDQRNWNNMTEVMTRWQKTGDVTNIPRVVFGDNISNGSGIVISENVEKGDFIKARNIALGYTMPKSVTDRLGINSIRFYGGMQNAFTITKYTGFDPETSTNGNANGSPSVDRNSVPQARTIVAGVNIGF
ncbi:MAG: TonB-dependent receptor [Sphingobacteriales bacterium]|nr:MAG: TonB-dependent receptor [Sphingobacteriales bacterium]